VSNAEKKAAKNSLKNALKKGKNAERINKIRVEILKKKEQIVELKKDPKNEKLIKTIQKNIQILNDRIESIENPVIKENSSRTSLKSKATNEVNIADMNEKQLKAAVEALPDDNGLESAIEALANPNDELDAQVEASEYENKMPNKQMNTNAKIALLSEDLLREQTKLDRLKSKDNPNKQQIAETVHKIRQFTKQLEELRPANENRLRRNVIRAEGELRDAERNVFFEKHIKFSKPGRTIKNVENAKAKLKAAQNKLRNLKPLNNLWSNTSLMEELAALPNKPNGSPPILSRYIEPNQPKRLTSKGNDTFVAPPKNAVPIPIRPKRLTSKGNDTFVAPPKNAVPILPIPIRPKRLTSKGNDTFVAPPKNAVPRPRRPKRVSPVKNPLQLETNMSDVVNAHPTIVGVFNSPSPSVSNLDPNMSGVGATLVNRPSPSVSNSDQLKRDYLASRAKLAEAEDKLSGVMGSYIKNKEDYLVASIKFLLLQKKYVESGGNANFAAFTDPKQLDGSPLINSPLAGRLNRRMSGNHPQNNSSNEISTNRPTTLKRPSTNWFTGARNFFSKKAANYMASRKRISNARTTQKKDAANRAAEVKREKDARAAQLADAKRLAFQLAKNAAAEKAARQAKSAEEKAAEKAARQAKSAQEKAARNAERARAMASRKGNPAKSGTAHVIGQGALAPPMGSGLNLFSMF
jgi:hypothetical protein